MRHDIPTGHSAAASAKPPPAFKPRYRQGDFNVSILSARYVKLWWLSSRSLVDLSLLMALSASTFWMPFSDVMPLSVAVFPVLLSIWGIGALGYGSYTSIMPLCVVRFSDGAYESRIYHEAAVEAGLRYMGEVYTFVLDMSDTPYAEADCVSINGRLTELRRRRLN